MIHCPIGSKRLSRELSVVHVWYIEELKPDKTAFPKVAGHYWSALVSFSRVLSGESRETVVKTGVRSREPSEARACPSLPTNNASRSACHAVACTSNPTPSAIKS
jgi:hypothetical protein